MTTAQAVARSNKPPPIAEAKPTSRKRATAKPTKARKLDELTTIRNALPFFNPGNRKVDASWWSVTPSGNYSADLETGKDYARAFLPMMTFNAGASTLGHIVSHMAMAGRDEQKNPKAYRGIDDIALGFLMEIGNSLQAAIMSISIAACAIKKPETDLGAKFLELVENGGMLRASSRSTLFHDPGASIFAKAGQ